MWEGFQFVSHCEVMKGGLAKIAQKLVMPDVDGCL